ncbi:uncharacterized protein L3040_002061 [Drepanopeziza brunnea f. sp. 'multigermtubi']|uniref:uncharacterized protein n=1 Tax=Drepanopeziza brunnea f. sp. 'multigermtubi' TaxID=698441 RepID=UPI00239986E4|nr:hypothetical protein L3040_002061 [Drepanopeziza brunnea f. sp. 'multigermtubi']
METTFMTIHNLSPEAIIMFASESIVDILGFAPEEVIGRSWFDYFHPDDLFTARHFHHEKIKMDRASVLHYPRIGNRDGYWVSCECVFTVVYDVLVSCTSIYRGPDDARNTRRAEIAPQIERIFASSPRDPRYHMLEHLSSKFRAPPQPSFFEPRAALILNRFTRTLTVMYATNAVSSILGVTPEQFKDKSFYECMQENCLPAAIRALESAKANDSIAYLRFWRRDPRRAEDLDDDMRDASQSSDSEDGGVVLNGYHADGDPKHPPPDGEASTAVAPGPPGKGERTDPEETAAARRVLVPSPESRSSTSSSLVLLPQPERVRRRAPRAPRVPSPAPEPYQVEAVVSCTSDGLVVVLRRARPLARSMQQPAQAPRYENGLFAAPWGANPIRPHLYQPDPRYPFQHGLHAPLLPAGGPPVDEFMNSIREVAVFAWSLTGINGNMAAYGHGIPRGEAQPPGGLPIWDPYHAQPSAGFLPPENQAAQRWARAAEARANERGNAHHGPAPHHRPEESSRRRGPPVDATRQAQLAAPSHAPSSAYPYDPEPGPQPRWLPAADPLPAAEAHPPPTRPRSPRGQNVGHVEHQNHWY